MFRFLLAPDSFKGALSATQACEAMQRGIIRAVASTHCDCEIVAVPLADGGEGTVEAFHLGAGGALQTATVSGPLGETVEAQWLLLPDGRAVIEMAQASGLTLIAPEKRRALEASTYGTGQLIKAALDAGCPEILIGIGGSATTDGGMGALQALGVRFLNEAGNELPPGGAALLHLHRIDTENLDSRLQKTSIRVLCDVTNPLFGESGAAYVYAQQKGASPEDLKVLDAALCHYAHIVSTHIAKDLSQTPGAGAAGGIGFGLLAFCNAQLVRGIDAVLVATKFAEKLKNADLVLTAEGAIDEQTHHGKALAGVANAARNAKEGVVPIIAFGGAINLRGEELRRIGICSAFPLANAPMSLECSMENADELLENVVERALSLWLCAKS